VDIWKTYNLVGDCVKLRYVATHEVMGKLVKDYDVLETTIARGIVRDAALEEAARVAENHVVGSVSYAIRALKVLPND
jgi:hypothetical protein